MARARPIAAAGACLRERLTSTARDWNARDSKRGYVTRFAVRRAYLDQYDIHTVGSAIHQEYWIPAERLAEFNAQNVGEIAVIAEYAPTAQG